MYKRVLTETLKKNNGSRKGRLTLEVVEESGNCTALTIKEFLEHPASYKPSPYSEGEFLKGLYSQMEMRERMDMNVTFKRKGITSFIDKLEYLKSLIRYSKKQGVIA